MMLQISSAHGPLERQLAAAKALQRLQVEADACRVALPGFAAVARCIRSRMPGTEPSSSLSGRERMLETSAIIASAEFAHYLPDDRPRGLRGQRCIGRERPGPAPRQSENQETR